MAEDDALLRKLLIETLRGTHAHIDFESTIADFPADKRGAKPAGAPHSAWELLEHMRIAQHDILEFSRDPNYRSPKWPDAYWPSTEAPPEGSAWDESVKAFRKNAREFDKLVDERQQDLFQPFAHGKGQTLLREALVLAAHNSYHLGQLVFLKKTLAAPARD